MTTQNFKQTKKVGAAGSFINQMYGNNNSIPVVGEYCTFLHYTDRTIGIVREIKDNTVVIEGCETIANKNTKNDIGHQNWVHNPVITSYSIHYTKLYETFTNNSVVFNFTDNTNCSIGIV